jgi:hypothetical protein
MHRDTLLSPGAICLSNSMLFTHKYCRVAGDPDGTPEFALYALDSHPRRFSVKPEFLPATTAVYGTYVSSSRSGSLGVEKSLELYKRTQS